MKTLVTYLSVLLVVCAGLVSGTTASARGGIDVKIRLTGPAIRGVVPQGSSEFRADATRTSFRVEANRVNLPNGTWLSVQVNGTSVGNIVLVAGAGKLQLESEQGQAVPTIHAGDVVTVSNSSNGTVLSGKF